MSVLIAGAALTLFIACACLLGAALLVSRTARHDREQRLALVTVPSGPGEAWREGAGTPMTDSVAGALSRFFAIGMPYRWGTSEHGFVTALVALASFAGTWLFVYELLRFSPWIATPVALIVGFAIPNILLRIQQSKAERKFLDIFPDAVDMIVRMLRAGLPVSSTMRAVAHEAGAPVNAVFKTIADRIDIGVPFEEALGIAAAHVGLTDFRFFAAAVSLQRATGGNLAATLEILCDIVRKRRAIRLKARAATAEVRISAYVLAALPFCVVGGLMLVAPRYLAPLVTDPRGNFIIALAVLLLLLALVTMRMLMDRATKL